MDEEIRPFPSEPFKEPTRQDFAAFSELPASVRDFG